MQSGIYYQVYEGGDYASPPLVLIHGVGGTFLDWPTNIRRLGNLRVFALDLPGHGRSDGCGQQSVERYAENILTWLDAAGLYRAMFIGHSLGSNIAMHIARYYPDRVSGLILMCVELCSNISPSILETITQPNTYVKGVQMLAEGFSATELETQQVDMRVKHLMTNRASVLHGDLLACSQYNLNGDLASITAETLVVCGESENFHTRRQAQYLVDSLLNAKLSVITSNVCDTSGKISPNLAIPLHTFITSIPHLPGRV